MKNTAKVISLKNNNIVEVLPLISDACIGCTKSSCTKQGHAFTVRNTLNLPVYEGAVVRIGASSAKQAVQALFSLFLPLAASIAGYIFTPDICALAGRTKAVTEATLIAGVFISFYTTAALVLIFNRFIRAERHAIITEIITSSFNDRAGTTPVCD